LFFLACLLLIRLRQTASLPLRKYIEYERRYYTVHTFQIFRRSKFFVLVITVQSPFPPPSGEHHTLSQHIIVHLSTMHFPPSSSSFHSHSQPLKKFQATPSGEPLFLFPIIHFTVLDRKRDTIKSLMHLTFNLGSNLGSHSEGKGDAFFRTVCTRALPKLGCLNWDTIW
jgi:hypothetical protein